jgi:hypothetical protein
VKGVAFSRLSRATRISLGPLSPTARRRLHPCRLAVIAGDPFRPQEAADRLCFHRVSDNNESHSVHSACLAERERVCLGAGLEERDLQRPLADPVVLSHELVEAALPEQAVPVLVHVHAV